MGYIENASLILGALIPYHGSSQNTDSGIFGRSTAAVGELAVFQRVSFTASTFQPLLFSNGLRSHAKTSIGG